MEQITKMFYLFSVSKKKLMIIFIVNKYMYEVWLNTQSGSGLKTENTIELLQFNFTFTDSALRAHSSNVKLG